MPTPEHSRGGNIATATRRAADWVARRDRGLTAREQDEYLEWLRADPRHAALVSRHESTLRRMQGLAQWQPALSEEANPDLFAPRRRRRRWLAPLLATAAALAIGAFFLAPTAPVAPPTAASPVPASNYLRWNERQSLPDGSVVELREGTKLDLQFSAEIRRVRLSGGEAHFHVAKDSDRPFVVEAGAIAVRAVGTAFNVRLDAATVDVLVTSGRVSIEAAPAAVDTPVAPVAAPVFLAASQRTVMPLAPTPVEPEIRSVTPAQIKEALAWQAPRLQFHETPLGEAVLEFNRHNRHRLILGDPALAAVPIGGSFRVDNVAGFVRLLEVTLGIRGEPRGADETLLRRAR